MPKISVIVPVYKAENYLSKCVDSMLAQSFADFELILVNDGSPDGSPLICDNYAQSDPRVLVVHQSNAGVSAARNAGIFAAQGDYLVFVDSDDFVSSTYLEELYKGYLRSADIAICGYYVVTNDLSVLAVVDRSLPQEYIGDISKVFKNIIESDLLNSPWNKLFKTKVIKENHISFDKNMTLGEDLCFNIAYLYNCKTCYICNLPLYYYIKSNSVLSKKITLDYFNIQKHLFETVNKFIEDKKIICDLSNRVELLLSDALGFLSLTGFSQSKHEVCAKMKEILEDNLVDKYISICDNSSYNKSLLYYLISTRSALLIMHYFQLKNMIGKILRNKIIEEKI